LNDLDAEAVRHLLTCVPWQTGGNQVRAARLLGITRGSPRTKVRELGTRIGLTVTDGS
jgi:two-component system nitrogen regulation response regulator GlnG